MYYLTFSLKKKKSKSDNSYYTQHLLLSFTLG